MKNTMGNRLFLIQQIDEFLSRFPIGRINVDNSIQSTNTLIKFYIEILQDCIHEDEINESI